MKSKGFTLIELLVVIAIIGILSSVVLASLNSARVKGADAAIKSQMASMMSQGEVYYDSSTGGDGDYDGVCSDATIVQALAVIASNDGTAAAVLCDDSGAGAAAQKWAVSTTLKATGTWCVDNSGWKKAGVAAAGVCTP